MLCPAGAAGRRAAHRAGSQPTRPQILGSGYAGRLPPEHPQRDLRSSETPPAAAGAAAPHGSPAHAAVAHAVHADFCAGQRCPRAISVGEQPSGGQPAWRSSTLPPPACQLFCSSSAGSRPSQSGLRANGSEDKQLHGASRHGAVPRARCRQSSEPSRARHMAHLTASSGGGEGAVPGEAEPAVRAAAICSASRALTETMLLSALFLDDGVEMGLSWRAERQSLASEHVGAANVSRLHTPGQLPSMQARPSWEPYMHQARSRAATAPPAAHAHGAPLLCSEFMGAQRGGCPAPASQRLSPAIV